MLAAAEWRLLPQRMQVVTQTGYGDMAATEYAPRMDPGVDQGAVDSSGHLGRPEGSVDKGSRAVTCGRDICPSFFVNRDATPRQGP